MTSFTRDGLAAAGFVGFETVVGVVATTRLRQSRARRVKNVACRRMLDDQEGTVPLGKRT